MSHYCRKGDSNNGDIIFNYERVCMYVWVYVRVSSGALRVCKRALNFLELHPEDCELTDADAGN